jgi:uncharacterized protein (DUF697 family)
MTMIETMTGLEKARRECRKLVVSRSLSAATTSIVPVPGLDIAADIGLLTSLLAQINERFGLSEAQVERLDPGAAQKALLIAAGLGNGMIGRAISKRMVAIVLKRVATRLAVGSAARFVPFVGSALAAGLGFSAMKVAGDAHIEDCYRTARALLDGGSHGGGI